MIILGIDPGTTESGWVLYDSAGDKLCLVDGAPSCPNAELLRIIDDLAPTADRVAIEMIASYGMAVGAEVFDTCVWIGRFVERASRYTPDEHLLLVPRLRVKQAICHDTRAKDTNIRAALLDRFGGAAALGNKKAPGPIYRCRAHMWAALAVAVTVATLEAGR